MTRYAPGLRAAAACLPLWKAARPTCALTGARTTRSPAEGKTATVVYTIYMRTNPIGVFIALAFIIAVSVLPASVSARSLTSGLSGADVKTLQTQLIAKGYLSASATGYFGPLTLAAVKKFQCDNAIVCSGSSYGIFGPRTQAALAGSGLSAGVGTSGSVGASTAQAPAGVTPGVDPNQQGVITGKSIGPKWTGALEFSGWMPDWRAQQSVDDVTPHLNQLTSVMPFGYKVNADGLVVGDFIPSQEP